ncbi:MAG: hypothetical protein PVH99_16960 [Desulfobacteraceae bacterium]|jgi:hypothetical protein
MGSVYDTAPLPDTLARPPRLRESNDGQVAAGLAGGRAGVKDK